MLGADLPEIVEPFRAARDADLYERVGRNTLPGGETVRAYAVTNHHEYFAELSEAYLALNDFEPYTRLQLEKLDPAGFEMVRMLWNLSAEEIAAKISAATPYHP
jgi:dipeptidyl-peptidase-4